MHRKIAAIHIAFSNSTTEMHSTDEAIQILNNIDRNDAFSLAGFRLQYDIVHIIQLTVIAKTYMHIRWGAFEMTFSPYTK